MAQDRVPYQPDVSPEEKSSLTPQPVRSQKSGLSYMDDIDYHRIANFFDISYDDRRDLRVAEKLSYLTDWALAHGAKDNIDVLARLKDVSRELGLSIKGADLIKKLYEFTRLNTQKEAIDKEIGLYKEKQEEQPKEEKLEVKVDSGSIKRIVQKEMAEASKAIKSTLKSHITRNIKKLEIPKEPPQSTNPEPPINQFISQ